MKTLLCTVLLLATSLRGQISVATITDETTPSSKAVMLALRSKIGSHPKQFTSRDRRVGGRVFEKAFWIINFRDTAKHHFRYKHTLGVRN